MVLLNVQISSQLSDNVWSDIRPIVCCVFLTQEHQLVTLINIGSNRGCPTGCLDIVYQRFLAKTTRNTPAKKYT